MSNLKVDIIPCLSDNYSYIVSDGNQALVIASVAVDLRITQLVDAPNVGVTAVLPLDIFVGEMVGTESP